MRKLIPAVVALLMACGSSGTGTGGGTGGSAGGGTGGSTGGGTGGSTGGGTGGSAGGGAGGGSAAGGGSGAAKVGSVTLSQFEGGVFLGLVRSGSAAFYPDGVPVPVGALSCTFGGASGCEFADCTHDGGIPGVDGGRPVNAGAVTVQTNGVTIALNALTTGSYSGTANDGGVWWNGGEAVTASATGSMDGGAPAFTASFNAPTRLSFTAPANDGGSLIVAKGSPLPITWAAGTGTVTISLQSGQLVGGHSYKLTCTANASAGTFTIPGTLTQNLISTNAGSLQVTNSTETTVTPSGWTIRASASSTGQTRAVSVP